MKSILLAFGIASIILVSYLHGYDKIDWFRSDSNISDQIDQVSNTKIQDDFSDQGISTEHQEVIIEQRWDMPDDLEEISGMSYMNEKQFACIQDEDGKIFIYDIEDKKIVREIDFAGQGDYEAIALVGKTAYIARSDGHIFEVDNIDAGKPKVIEYHTSLGSKQNVEGLCYDKKYDRLLVSIKGRDEHSKDYKGIYEFKLATKTLTEMPVYMIRSKDEMLKTKKGKYTSINPSDISINPVNDMFYITDGPSHRLVIMDRNNNIRDLIELDKTEFLQPEGICFSPSGKMYISNEGTKKKPGTLMEVSLKKN